VKDLFTLVLPDGRQFQVRSEGKPDDNLKPPRAWAIFCQDDRAEVLAMIAACADLHQRIISGGLEEQPL
jgi:hypothetical protein